jgi:hypothetical protein
LLITAGIADGEELELRPPGTTAIENILMKLRFNVQRCLSRPN